MSLGAARCHARKHHRLPLTVRATKDLDFLVEIEAAQNIHDALLELGYQCLYRRSVNPDGLQPVDRWGISSMLQAQQASRGQPLGQGRVGYLGIGHESHAAGMPQLQVDGVGLPDGERSGAHDLGLAEQAHQTQHRCATEPDLWSHDGRTGTDLIPIAPGGCMVRVIGQYQCEPDVQIGEIADQRKFWQCPRGR